MNSIFKNPGVLRGEKNLFAVQSFVFYAALALLVTADMGIQASIPLKEFIAMPD